MKIFKYTFPVGSIVELKTHQVYKILHFAVRSPAEITVWALVDENTKKDHQVHNFIIYGTGHPVDPETTGNYLTTVIDALGLVWHIFEGTEDRI